MLKQVISRDIFMKTEIEAATGAPRGGGGRHRNKPTKNLEMLADYDFLGKSFEVMRGASTSILKKKWIFPEQNFPKATGQVLDSSQPAAILIISHAGYQGDHP